jgi:predicted flap endonuclease-1-like 5' DNA nuclease
MAQNNFKQAPRFEMWVMAIGVALVAAGVAYVVGGFSLNQAGFVGAGLALVVILAFGLAPSDRSRTAEPEAESVPDVVVHAPVAAAPVMAAAPVLAADPVMAAAPVLAAAPAVAAKPAGLSGPRGGKADDLKIVKGIGPKLELLCHSLGFYHFDQVANWTAAELAWVDDNLEGFKGRVTRDRWQPQAKAIVALGPDEFLRQLDAGKEF